MYRLHLQGRKIRERGTSVSRWLQTVNSTDVPLKRQLNSQDIHGATSQETAFFKVELNEELRPEEI
jgi:hypothetical protein